MLLSRGLQDPAAVSSITIMIQAEKERAKMVGLFCFLKEDYEAVFLPCAKEVIIVCQWDL